jgi:hypothetical protein
MNNHITHEFTTVLNYLIFRQINQIVKALFCEFEKAEQSLFDDYERYEKEHGEAPNWDSPVIFLTKNGETGWYWGGNAAMDFEQSESLKFNIEYFQGGPSESDVEDEIRKFMEIV